MAADLTAKEAAAAARAAAVVARAAAAATASAPIAAAAEEAALGAQAAAEAAEKAGLLELKYSETDMKLLRDAQKSKVHNLTRTIGRLNDEAKVLKKGERESHRSKLIMRLQKEVEQQNVVRSRATRQTRQGACTQAAAAAAAAVGRG